MHEVSRGTRVKGLRRALSEASASETRVVPGYNFAVIERLSTRITPALFSDGHEQRDWRWLKFEPGLDSFRGNWVAEPW
jgi:hypothetical protein